MAGGCLPMILRLVIMMSIYWLIMSPLTYLMGVDSGIIAQAKETLGGNPTELQIISAVREGTLNIPEISSKLGTIDFNLFGLNLTQTPKFSFNIFKDAQAIWIMPLIAFLAQLMTSIASSLMQKKINPDAPSMMGMMVVMPLFSLFIGFGLPGGVTFYWACSSLIGGIIQIGVQQFYGPHKMLSRERAKELSKQCDFEQKQIEKLQSGAGEEQPAEN